MTDAAEEVVDAIIYDLCSRRGLRQAWEEIDVDVQTEIRQEWEKIYKIVERRKKS